MLLTNKVFQKFSLIFLSFCIVSCDTEAKTDNSNSINVTSPKTTYHYNIIITPDLSNRLLINRPVTDSDLVATILNNIYPRIITKGKSMNQYDIFSTSIISNNFINKFNVDVEKLTIDFARFKKEQKRRIQYINGVNTNENLATDKAVFLKEYNRISNSAANSTAGADLWNYFNENIDGTLIKKDPPRTSFNGKEYPSEYRNIMILFTDGYIEASMFGKSACKGNQCHYLSSELIKSFRAAYKKSGITDLKVFYKKNNYGIKPLENSNLNDLEVLVMQMEDRSLNAVGNTTVFPTDRQIIELFWADWLTKSGVKRFKLTPAYSSKAQAEKVILDFIGV
jgi:hypothetical protein